MRKVNLKGKIIGIFLIAVAILFTLSYSKNSLAQHNNIGEHIDFQVEKLLLFLLFSPRDRLPKKHQLLLVYNC